MQVRAECHCVGGKVSLKSDGKSGRNGDMEVPDLDGVG